METRVAMLAGPNNRSSHDVGVIRLPWQISVMKNSDDFPGGPDRGNSLSQAVKIRLSVTDTRV